MYSITSAGSLETVKILNDKILNALGTDNVPRVLVGNKSDLRRDRLVLASPPILNFTGKFLTKKARNLLTVGEFHLLNVLPSTTRI